MCLAYHDTYVGSWFCNLYPFAGNSKSVSRSPLTYCGVPAALLCREDMSMAVLFGIDISSDYLNPTTWTGKTGLHFDDQKIAPQFRAGGGTLSPEIEYRLPLQLFLSDAGNSAGAVTQLVEAWIKRSDFKVEPLFVRTPNEALDFFLEGRRKTSHWIPGKGYLTQQNRQFITVGEETPKSAYFEYLIYEMTGDKLWRQRSFEQMDFVLKGQQADPSKPHYGMIHSKYTHENSRYGYPDHTFHSFERRAGLNPGYKVDINAATARYMLLTWQQVKKHEGIDRQDWYKAAVLAADWVVRQQNPDGGLPQKVEIKTGKKSISVASGRAIAALPAISKITGDGRYLKCAERMEQFMRKNVEGRFWFTGQHIDLPPGDFESDSIWGAVEYWLDKYQRTGNKECLDRAVADAYLSLLWWCPKQLSWVKVPTQCGHCEQVGYLQYSCYCYANRKVECLRRLGKLTGDPLFSNLSERVMQTFFWTQATEGDLMGATHEAICDPWLARRKGFGGPLGSLYLNGQSLVDVMLTMIESGTVRACSRSL